MDPNFVQGYFDMGLIYAESGMYQQAIAELEKGGTLSGGNPQFKAGLGLAYTLSGRRDEALKILDQLNEEAKRGNICPCVMGVVYAGLCEKDRTPEWMEKAYEERASELIFVTLNSLSDDLRSDTRFQDLFRSIGMPS